MKYRFIYLKKGRKYDFVKYFKDDIHFKKKYIQYEYNSINFKCVRIC